MFNPTWKAILTYHSTHAYKYIPYALQTSFLTYASQPPQSLERKILERE
jgi:hypothetical protein